MTQPAKSPADQTAEIAKLIADAQDKLDQAVRALRSLQQRLAGERDEHASGGCSSESG